jgi:hypothetical protein
LQKRSKCVDLAQEIGLSAPPNSRSLLQLVNGTTQLSTSKNEFNKIEANCSSIFLIGIIMIGPVGLLHVVPTYVQFQLQLIGGVAKKKQLTLDILILLSRVTF